MILERQRGGKPENTGAREGAAVAGQEKQRDPRTLMRDLPGRELSADPREHEGGREGRMRGE